MQRNFARLKESFCSIFRENSKGARLNFFGNQLVQFLWKHYIQVDESTITKYFCDMINVGGDR